MQPQASANENNARAGRHIDPLSGGSARSCVGSASRREAGAWYRQRVQPEEIQKLRKDLACTARELATALGVDAKDIASWEAGETFPTKRHVQAMAALRERGPSAIVRAPRGKAAAKTGMQRLNDPALWRLVRKLLEHPALFDEAAKLAEKYKDPAE